MAGKANNVRNSIAVIAFAIALTIGGCSQEKQNPEAAQKRAAKAEEATIAAFAASNDAVMYWGKSISTRPEGQVFTADVAEALIPTNGQAVLLAMELGDVAVQNGKPTAQFMEVETGTNHTFTLRLLLSCTAEQANELRHASTTNLALRFAIATKINSVSRPVFEITTPENQDHYDIEADSIPDVFIAKGTCVDFIPIEGTEITTNSAKPTQQ